MPRKPKADGKAKVDRPKRETKKKEEPAKVAPEEAKKESPKKVKKAAGERKKKSHPTYKKMIFRALKELDDRSGSSSYAIAKYIKAKYSVPETYKRYLKHALRRELENKNLVKVKASYKLSAKGQKRGERKKRKKSKSKSAERKKSPEKREKKEKKKSAEKKSRTKKEGKKRAKAKDSPAKEGKAEAAVIEAPKAPPKKARGGSSVGLVKAKAVGSKYDHVWQYEDNGAVWKNYDIAASDTVEEVYQGYLANRGDSDVRAVKSGEWEYQVDFMALKQTNIQHPSHKVRNIRRVPVEK